MKPSILFFLRSKDLKIYKKIYNTGKYNLIVSADIAGLLQKNNIRVEKFEDFIPNELVQTCTISAQQLCSQVQAVFKNPQFQKQFVFDGHNFFREVEQPFLQSLLNQIPQEILFIEAFKNLFRQRDVRLVVVWTDVIRFTKTITFIAQKLKVPVLQIFHGALPSYTVGYFESIIYADKAAGRGEKVVEWARIYGQENKVVVTGNPYLDVYHMAKKRFNKVRICEKWGLDSKQPIVVFGSTWVHSLSTTSKDGDWLESALRRFLQGFKKLKDKNPQIQLIIKLHPTHAGQGDFYQNLARQEGINDALVLDDHLAEALFVCDALVTFPSSIIADALILDKPVLVFDYLENSTDKFYYKDYPIVFITDLREMGKALEAIVLRKESIHISTEKRRKMIRELNYLNDGKATERIVELMDNMVRDAKPVKETRTEDTAGSAYYYNYNPVVLELVPAKLKRVLDVGCSGGILGMKLKEKGIKEVYGIEAVEAVAEDARRYLDSVVVGDIENIKLPFPEDFFDGIIFGDVLEHLKDPWSTLKRMARFLTQTGLIFCSIPNIAHISTLINLLQGRWEYQDQGILDRTHLRFFTLHEIEQMIDGAGFRIVQTAQFRTPLHPEVQNLISFIANAGLGTPAFLENCDVLQHIIVARKKKRKKR